MNAGDELWQKMFPFFIDDDIEIPGIEIFNQLEKIKSKYKKKIP